MAKAKESFWGYRELQEAIRTDTAGGVYLFEGEEENLKHTAWNALRKHILPEGFEDMNETVLEAPETDALIAACETLPFFGERRLVTVRDQAGLNTARAETDDRLVDYLPRLPDTAVLVFYHVGSANGTRKLFKAIKACGRVVRFERMKEAELGAWAVQAFRKHGVECPPAAANYLVFTCGTDTGVLRNEIEKLASYVQEGQPVTEEDIRAIATPSVECTVFNLVDAVLDQHRAEAFRLLQELRRNGADDVLVLAMLLRQYRLMRQAQILRLEHKGPAETQSLLGMQDYAVRRLMRQTAATTGRIIRESLALCLNSEFAFKSGRLSQTGLADGVLLRLFALQDGAVPEA